ncbi:hypothetical protein DLM78_08830 [Leptospira stimsonii]|uniref:Uncharacterized protein n=1 Tax=Leptospira stimsonii TaxID=2202203 RepID=A0A8B3CP57_9LEPT|nr:hypothetical protein DLM78_08830 [Leptospira stimsonii]
MSLCNLREWEFPHGASGRMDPRQSDRRKLLESVSSYFFLHQESPLAKRKSRNSHVFVSLKNLSRKGIPVRKFKGSLERSASEFFRQNVLLEKSAKDRLLEFSVPKHSSFLQWIECELFC